MKINNIIITSDEDDETPQVIFSTPTWKTTTGSEPDPTKRRREPRELNQDLIQYSIIGKVRHLSTTSSIKSGVLCFCNQQIKHIWIVEVLQPVTTVQDSVSTNDGLLFTSCLHVFVATKPSVLNQNVIFCSPKPNDLCAWTWADRQHGVATSWN